MLHGSGEVVERRTKRARRDDAEIHLQPRPQKHRPAGLTRQVHPLDRAERRKPFHDAWSRELGLHEQIHISNGLFAAPIATRHLDALDPLRLSHMRKQRSDQVVYLGE